LIAAILQKPLELSVIQQVGSPLCVASDDGQKVFDEVCFALKQQQPVQLSFFGVEILTAAFLNVAIGQLYGVFSHEQIQNLLQVEDIESNNLVLLKQVVDNAKAYFENLKNPGSLFRIE
jgi:hypothetical protein